METRRRHESMALKPDNRGRVAYGRGYEAGLSGEDRDPYQHVPLRRGGTALSAWWATGRQDALAGRERRFQEGK